MLHGHGPVLVEQLKIDPKCHDDPNDWMFFYTLYHSFLLERSN